jgi:hypothetical protein
MSWKKKLTSRKMWAAIASFVALLIVALGGAQAQATQVTALIMAGATVVAYIVGEGLVDAASAGSNNVTIPADPVVKAADDITAAAQAVKAVAEDVNPQAPTEGGAVASDTTGAV